MSEEIDATTEMSQYDALISAQELIRTAPTIRFVRLGFTYYRRNGTKWGAPICDGAVAGSSDAATELIIMVPNETESH